jgi:tetratricopeptide (TPR) repeat protein
MNRITFALIVLFIAVQSLFAQGAGTASADLDRIDQFLIKKIKAESGKSDVQIYQELGLTYLRQENFDRSFMYFNKAVALDSRAYWAWYYMGLLNLRNPEDYFKKAIQANPRFAPPYYWLGRYYCKKKNIKESRKFFEDYIRAAKSDSNEVSRINVAMQFIDAMKSGETDYDRILRKIDQAGNF